MKKIYSLIFCFLMSLSALLISFLPLKNMNSNQAEASLSLEQKYYDSSTIELVSKHPTSVTGATADKTPFDVNTRQRMEGISITPEADDYGQVDRYSFMICSGSGYTPEVDDNILMWVYLIDAITFKLEISLGDGSSNELVWLLDSQKLYSIGSGWKLISLKLSDHSDKLEGVQKTYGFITFKYLSEASDYEGEDGFQSYETKTNERFSFYHIFTSKNANLIKKTGNLYSLDKSFYKFSEDFNIGKNAFVGDKIKIESPSKIFEYLYIGKLDLSDYLTSGKYFWSVSLKTPNSATLHIDFGDILNFYEKGFYLLSIQLFEELTLEDELILNVGLNIYSDELSLGSFSMGSSFKIINDEKIVVALTLSDALTDMGDIEVSLTNNNAEIESYYEEDGILYVCLIGKSNGKVNLEMTAEAMSKYGEDKQTFSSVATIDVVYTKGQVDIFIVVLWISFAVFCLGIIIYLSISVVQSRKNDVK